MMEFTLTCLWWLLAIFIITIININRGEYETYRWIYKYNLDLKIQSTYKYYCLITVSNYIEILIEIFTEALLC